MRTKETNSSRISASSGMNSPELNQICSSFFPGFSELGVRKKALLLGFMIELRSTLARMRLLNRIDPIQMVVPFPWQKEKLAVKKKFNFALGANRPGKTNWLVLDCALCLEARHPHLKLPRNSQLYFLVADYKKIEGVVLPKLRSLIPSSRMDFNQTTMTITMTKGRGKGNKLFILSQEADAKTFDAFSAHRFYIDEEPTAKIFGRVLARCVDHKAQILMAATPEDGLTWMWYDYWQKWRDKDPTITEICHITELTMYDNPTLDRGEIDRLYEAIKRTQGELIARIKVMGEPLNLAGTPYFNMEMLDRLIKAASHIVPETGDLQEIPA